MRKILHIDMDAFFASVEQMDRKRPITRCLFSNMNFLYTTIKK